MKNDVEGKTFFENDERYADLINGLLCNGRQILREGDLTEISGQVRVRIPKAGTGRSGQKYKKREKMQDIVRKAAFGMNFILIGLENQETIDYSLPLRCMEYDVGQYEKQAAKIRRSVRKRPKGLKAGEYLYGLKKDSRLCPSIILVLYYGEDEWDGPMDLHGMLNFMDIPEELHSLVQNYQIHLGEVRKLENTDVFKTDIKLVFDLIRYSDDEEKLAQLVKEEPGYQKLEWDAYELAVMYTGIGEKLDMKCYETGTVNVCKGILGIEEKARRAGHSAGKTEGKIEGIIEGKIEGKIEGQLLEQVRLITKKVQKGQSMEQIAEILEKDPKEIADIYRAVVSSAPRYDVDEICKDLMEKQRL